MLLLNFLFTGFQYGRALSLNWNSKEVSGKSLNPVEGNKFYTSEKGITETLQLWFKDFFEKKLQTKF